MEPVQLKSNQYWGKRSGGYATDKPKNISTPWGNVFKISRGSTNVSDNKGPTGHKSRWYFARAMSRNGKPIKNPEHQKKVKGK